MKKFANIVIIISILLIFCVKGIAGNVNENNIIDQEWLRTGPFDLSPERGRFALLMSIVDNNSFYFSLPIARFTTPDLGYKDGKYVSLFAPGVSYIVAPGYILGKFIDLSQVGAYSIIAIFALFNLFLVRSISKKLGATTTAATIASLIFLFATPAFTYATTLYQHHISTFIILASLYLLIKWKNIWSTFLIWFLFAASIPVDYPNLFLMFPITIYATSRLFNLQKIKESIYFKINWKYLISFFGVILPISFFLWFNWQSYGNPLQLSGTVPSVNAIDESGKPTQPKNFEYKDTSEFTNPDTQKKSAVNFFNTRKLLNGFYIHLLSPDRGMLSYTPVIFISIIGAVIMYRQKNKFLNIFLGIIGLNLLLYSMWGDPYGGWAFGSRYLIPSYAIASIFLSFALTKLSHNILFLIPLFFTTVYSLAINTLGALTSIANPPKVEVLALEKLSGTIQKYTFERNWDFLLSGQSKSFLFQSFFNQYLSALQYYYLILGIILVIFVYLFISLIKQRNENIHQ